MSILLDRKCPHCKKTIKELKFYEFLGYQEYACEHCSKRFYVKTKEYIEKIHN